MLLIFSTPDFRNAFLKTIRQIIRESVRNMSLPGPETTLVQCNTTNRGKQYPEVINQEREPIKNRQIWENREGRSTRGVHYSPHIRTRDFKDDRQIIERNNIGKRNNILGSALILIYNTGYSCKMNLQLSLRTY